MIGGDKERRIRTNRGGKGKKGSRGGEESRRVRAFQEEKNKRGREKLRRSLRRRHS